MNPLTHSQRSLAAALLAGALLAPLLPPPGGSARAQEETVEIDEFTVVNRRNDQLNPRVDGRHVVWQDYRDIGDHDGDEGNADVYGKNLDSDDEFRVQSRRTSSRPDVSGDVVVFADTRNGDVDDRGYHIMDEESFWVIREANSDQDRPAIDGSLVVWQDNRDGAWNIRATYLDRDEEFWVSRRDANQTNPRVSGRIVVWQDDRDGCCDIYAKDLDSGDVTQVTDTNDAQDPDVAGNWIVYQRGDGDDTSIHAYNLETEETIQLNSTDDDRRGLPAVDGRLVVWEDRRNGDDYRIFGYDLEARQEFQVTSSGSNQRYPAVSGSRAVWVDDRSSRGGQVRGANLALPDTAEEPAAEPTPERAPPVVQGCPVPTAGLALRDARYFPQTGFRVDDDRIWNYFSHRGELDTFGYPISNTFQFMGLPTQFFQRQVVQVGPDGSPHPLNLLDPGLMPATSINFSAYPPFDPNVSGEAPRVSDPNYATAIVEFVEQTAPDSWQGMPVRFFSTFVQQVTLEEAFPNGGGNPALLPLLNLELSGAPTSQPRADPTNGNFVYQRFQRTILHFDAATGVTQPVLLADYFKELILGRAPADLMSEMAGSRFASQYDRAQPLGLNRPAELSDTNLCGAFDPR